MWTFNDGDLAREYCDICETVTWRHFRLIEGKLVNFCESCGYSEDIHGKI